MATNQIESQKMCACGRPLHYSDPRVQEFIERTIEQLGPVLPVRDAETGKRYAVPRHYIALHGLRHEELRELSLQEYSEEQS